MAIEQVNRGLPERRASASDYTAIMRLDHATKHVFVVPGIILALLLRASEVSLTVWPFIAGAIVAVLIASANYVINEWLDREFDAHHPTKSKRTAVQAQMDGTVVWILWACLVSVGLLVALSASKTMMFIALAFAAQGIFYNVKPLRLKDHAYVDVLSEFRQQSVKAHDRVGDGRSDDPAACEHHHRLLARRRLPDGGEAPVGIPRDCREPRSRPSHPLQGELCGI